MTATETASLLGCGIVVLVVVVDVVVGAVVVVDVVVGAVVVVDVVVGAVVVVDVVVVDVVVGAVVVVDVVLDVDEVVLDVDDVVLDVVDVVLVVDEVVEDVVDGSRLKVLVTDALSTSVSVIVSRAKWLPAVVNVFVTVMPVAVVPSLNSQT